MEITNLKLKATPIDKKENSILKSLVTSASKNLELFCQTLNNAKEKYKIEADSFLQFLKKNEESINKLIEEKTRYYDTMKEKVNEIFNNENLFEDLSLKEDKEVHQILYECNNYSNFYKHIKAIQEEIRNLEMLKENKNLKEFVENTETLPLEDCAQNDIKISSLENEKYVKFTIPKEPAILENSEKSKNFNEIKNTNISMNDSKEKNEDISSITSESEKIANKYIKYETPNSNKFLGNKKHRSSEADVESTGTNNQDEIDLIKDSEDNSANDDNKKNESLKVNNPNSISRESNQSSKKNYKFSMKREINALGLNSKIVKNLQSKKTSPKNQNINNNPNINSNNNNKNQIQTIKNLSNKEKQDNNSQNTLNSVFSDTIDLVSNSNGNLNKINITTNNQNHKKIENKNSNLNNCKSKSKGKNLASSTNKIINPDFSVTPKEDMNLTTSNKANTNNQKTKDIPNTDNILLKSSKFIEVSTELQKNIDTLTNLLKKDKNNYVEYIMENFEDCLFKQRIFYCEFDMLNKNKKCNSDLLGKDAIFENSENYEFVKLTIVRRGKQNINNLLKSMENFFKQYIKRKDIDGSAIIKGTINCSFEKLQKYFTMQMRSFEYCEAIQLEVYLFKWDLFYDFNEKEDKTNLDNNVIKQFVNYGNVLRETRILSKKKNLMLQATNME